MTLSSWKTLFTFFSFPHKTTCSLTADILLTPLLWCVFWLLTIKMISSLWGRSLDLMRGFPLLCYYRSEEDGKPILVWPLNREKSKERGILKEYSETFKFKCFQVLISPATESHLTKYVCTCRIEPSFLTEPKLCSPSLSLKSRSFHSYCLLPC